MKKSFICIVAIVSILICGCSSSNVSSEALNAEISKAEAINAQYESAITQLTDKDNEIESLENALEEAEGLIESVNEEIESISEEYDDYKEVMAEYEGLSEVEAEARMLTAESIAESESYRKESEAESESASLEAEEKKGYDTGISYNDLARNPDDYIGKKVKFKGKVVQTIEGTTGYNDLRLMVDNDYDKILYCSYSKDIVPSRILDDDKITVYGISSGLFSYQSTGAGTITIPSVLVDKIDQ